jgi:hypothetical protein
MMKCRAIQEMLFEYIDNNLPDELVKTIDTHLNQCEKCRIALSEYTEVREKLIPLRKIPIFPDMKEKITEGISTMKTSFGFKRFLRPALISVPVVVIVALVLALQPFGTSEDTSGIIARAYAATSKLNSFRYEKDDYHQDSPEVAAIHTYHSETEYVAPDRYYLSYESYSHRTPDLEGPIEKIVIENHVYTNAPLVYKLDSEYFDQLELTEAKSLDYLNMLTEVETLEDETIDGTECHHYKGKVDIDKFLEWSRPNFESMYYRMDKNLPQGMTRSLEEYIEDQNASYFSQDMTFEVWIGKDDYLLRRAKMVYETREGEISDWNEYRTICIMRYYDLNADITIEAPLDESGELLAGWNSYTLEPMEIPDESDTPEVAAVTKTPGENELIPEKLQKAAAVTENLNSYRTETTRWEYINGEWVITRNSATEYGGFNLFRSLKQDTEKAKEVYPYMVSDYETILINDQLYSRGYMIPVTSMGDVNDNGPTGEETRKMMEMLFDIETLPEEKINGTDCYHFRGILDVEKYIEWYRPIFIETATEFNETVDDDLYKMDPEEAWEGISDMYRAEEKIYEYWVGKDDYIIRKRVVVKRDLAANTLAVDDLSHKSTQQIITYYLDFNEPVEITPPLDESGELFPGWTSYTLGE